MAEFQRRNNVHPATFELVQQPTNTEFSPKTLATVVSEPSTSYKSAKIHPIQAHSFAVCSNLGTFLPEVDPAPSYLPVPTQLLTSQNLHPVTYQARKTHYLAEFRNPRLMVNPSLARRLSTLSEYTSHTTGQRTSTHLGHIQVVPSNIPYGHLFSEHQSAAARESQTSANKRHNLTNAVFVPGMVRARTAPHRLSPPGGQAGTAC